MNHSYLIVVDMQNDFITGILGTPEAQKILGEVVRKVENFPGQVIFTQDTHGADYLSTQEGKMLPAEHCILGTDGWELAAPLEKIRQERELSVYRKGTFASLDLGRDLYEENRKNPIDSIELIGLCTDICVVSNALVLKGFLPEVPVFVDAGCCAGVTPESHEAALQTMKNCQIIVRSGDGDRG